MGTRLAQFYLLYFVLLEITPRTSLVRHALQFQATFPAYQVSLLCKHKTTPLSQELKGSETSKQHHNTEYQSVANGPVGKALATRRDYFDSQNHVKMEGEKIGSTNACGKHASTQIKRVGRIKQEKDKTTLRYYNHV